MDLTFETPVRQSWISTDGLVMGLCYKNYWMMNAAYIVLLKDHISQAINLFRDSFVLKCLFWNQISEQTLPYVECRSSSLWQNWFSRVLLMTWIYQTEGLAILDMFSFSTAMQFLLLSSLAILVSFLHSRRQAISISLDWRLYTGNLKPYLSAQCCWTTLAAPSEHWMVHKCHGRPQ